MGMEREKQQIYPGEKINLGMEREKQEIYPSEKKIMGMDFFCIKHNIPDVVKVCHKGL